MNEQKSYRVTTQYVKIRKLRSELVPLVECTKQIGYAENYSCAYQDEGGAIHYD